MPLLLSCTPFFNELDVLEIRLATLDSVIDRHVIAEATVTHTGLPKPLYFAENLERFQPWLHKITHVVVDDMRDGIWAFDTWTREKHQRRSLIRGLCDTSPQDLILLSDVDEIPHPDAIRGARPPEHLRCHMHGGRLNWRWPGPTEDGYTISRVFEASLLETHDLEAIRLMPWSSRPESPAGWHLSYMADIGEKLAGFAHQEMVADATPERVRSFLEEGGDLFGRSTRHAELVGLDELPPYVAENRDRFSHLLVS